MLSLSIKHGPIFQHESNKIAFVKENSSSQKPANKSDHKLATLLCTYGDPKESAVYLSKENPSGLFSSLRFCFCRRYVA